VLRFAVHRPGNPGASPRSHGMTCRDVPGRIDIRMTGKTARPATEDGLALARSSVYRLAGAAGLRCECGVYSFDPAWSLILKPSHQEAPARSKDLPVEPGLLAHASAGQINGAFNRAGHVANVEILNADHLVAPGEISADLLAPVPTGIGLSGLEPGNGQHYVGAPVGAWLGPGELALQQPQPSPTSRTQSRSPEQLARRERNAYCNAPVQAHNLSCFWAGNLRWDDRERNVPASSAVECHSVGLRLQRHGPRPLEPQPASLRDPDLTCATVQSADVPRSDRDDTKSFVAPSFAPAWLSVASFEEGFHGLSKVPERLLLDHLASSVQPVMLPPGCGQLPALLQISRRGPTPRVPPRLLLNCQVPHESCMRAVVFQGLFLGDRRSQPIAAHTNTVSIRSDIPGLARWSHHGLLKMRSRRRRLG
jgi:hypothetical protein